jgi:hypothetical protein
VVVCVCLEARLPVHVNVAYASGIRRQRKKGKIGDG